MEPGTIIGRYHIEGELGRGGMGMVYVGWDADLQRKVAIKVLRDSRDGAAGRARLLREARAMAKLSHPNVVTVFEVGTHEGRDFIALELVDGKSLADWLLVSRTNAEILRVFIEAGRGLAAAHAAGMIHRDFKPENVLVRSDGRALVTDFGLVRHGLAHGPPSNPGRLIVPDAASADTLADSVSDAAARAPTALDPGSEALTQTGALLGTLGYIAPEQYRGRADARSDQFAFCVALWTALAGKSPFAGQSHDDMVDSIERGPTNTGQLPGRARAVLVRGLAADPDARWPSMDALLRELERPRRRARWLAVGGVATAGIAATAFFVATRRNSDERDPRQLLTGGAIRRLTLSDGCEEFPSLTPDGKSVVFDGLAGGSYAIKAVDIESGRTRQLTRGDVWEYKPAVSPDGRLVAFLRKDPRGVGTYIVGIAGGDARRIAAGDMQPIWDPDGRAVWVAYKDRCELVDVATGAVTRRMQMSPAALPTEGVVLPDGRIAAIMLSQVNVEAAGIAILDATKPPTWLVKAPFIEAIALTPDRRALLAAHLSQSRVHDLWWIPLDGKPPVAIPGAAPTSGLVMTPRGERIAWSDCEPSSSLASLAGDPLTLTRMPTGRWIDQEPASVPGTQQIVVTSDRSEGLHLWVLDVTRREPPRELPAIHLGTGSSPASFGTPAVASDGKTVYSLYDKQLVAQPLDGSQPPHVIATNVSGPPAPRRDGSIAIARENKIVLVPAGGGEPTDLVPLAQAPCAPPHGDELYYQSFDRATKYVVMRRDATGATRSVSSQLPAKPWRALIISEDGKRLALVDMSALTVVDTSTGNIVGTYDAGAAMLTGATWVGSSIVVSIADFQGDVWLFERNR